MAVPRVVFRIVFLKSLSGQVCKKTSGGGGARMVAVATLLVSAGSLWCRQMSFKDTKSIVKAVLVTQMSNEGQASLEESSRAA